MLYSGGAAPVAVSAPAASGADAGAATAPAAEEKKVFFLTLCFVV